MIKNIKIGRYLSRLPNAISFKRRILTYFVTVFTIILFYTLLLNIESDLNTSIKVNKRRSASIHSSMYDSVRTDEPDEVDSISEHSQSPKIQVNLSKITPLGTNDQENTNETNEERHIRRQKLLTKKCQNFKKYQPIKHQMAQYRYLHKSITLINNEKLSDSKSGDQGDPLLTACIPPKTGTTNWQMLLYSLMEEIPISQVKEIIEVIGSDFYHILPKLMSKGSFYRHDRYLSHNTGKYLNITTKIYKSIENENVLLYMPKGYLDKLVEVLDLLADSDPITLINVRHPFSRQISTWRDKFSIFPKGFEHPVTKFFQKEIKACMDLDLKHSRSSHTLSPGTDDKKSKYCTFESYLEILVEEILSDENIFSGSVSGQFLPVSYYCSPCDVPYNFISKSETSSIDSQYFMEQYFPFLKSDPNSKRSRKIKKGIFLPRKYGDSLIDDTDLDSLYLSMERFVKSVNVEILVKFYEKFYWDFELFGYEVERFLGYEGVNFDEI